MKTKRKTAICKNCNKKFPVVGHRKKFCKIKCTREFYSKNQKDYYGIENVHTTKRKCLNCRKKFNSYGIWNRICRFCKYLPDYNNYEDTYKFDGNAKR